jgi:AcrR family transcriptional regulator
VTRAESRERVLRATVQTLASEGYVRTTARAIARTGGFAPGVIYYHFTDLDDLFVTTARFTSQARLERYRAETAGVTGAVDLVRRLRRLHAEDGAEGHIAAVQELVAAATSSARLAQQVRVETALWRDFAETVLRGLLAGTPFAALALTRELATVAVAAYLGTEMLSHLDADSTAPEALFDAAERVAALADSLHLL